MLTQIDVECDNPFYMSVVGANPRDSLILQKVTGLGPPDKSLFVGDYTRDGGSYNGRRVGSRNVVLDIAINPNHGLGETVEGWREILYTAFNDPFVNGDDVTLVLHDDTRPDRMVTGYTEKFENEVFDADTGVHVSMICPDPYIRDVSETLITPPDGSVGWQIVPFTYSGTAEAGFEVWIDISTTTSALTLDNNGQLMVLTYPFLLGDTVYINTKPGQRQITFTRDGVTSDILYTLYSQSKWLTLHSQSNKLQIYGQGSANFVAAVTKFSYVQQYWGV